MAVWLAKGSLQGLPELWCSLRVAYAQLTQKPTSRLAKDSQGFLKDSISKSYNPLGPSQMSLRAPMILKQFDAKLPVQALGDALGSLPAFESLWVPFESL